MGLTWMHSYILGEISQVKRMAARPRIRDLPRLEKRYGNGLWRKMKGVATIRLRAVEASLLRMA